MGVDAKEEEVRTEYSRRSDIPLVLVAETIQRMTIPTTVATDLRIAAGTTTDTMMVHHLARDCENSCFLSPNLYVLDRVYIVIAGLIPF